MAIDKTFSQEEREAIKRVHFSGKLCKRCNKINPEGAASCRSCGYSKADTSKNKWYRRKAREPRG